MVPVAAPIAVGANDALIVQDPPAATELQLSVSGKLALGVRVKAIAVVPRLETVNVFAALVDPTPTLLKARVAGLTVTGAIPVPVKLAVWVAGVALSVTVRVPVPAPMAVGVNFKLITQLPPAASALPQVLVWAKSPVVAMLLTANGVVVLVFLKVMVDAALLLPSATLPNERDVVERVAVCPYAGTAEAMAKRVRKTKGWLEARRRRVNMLLLIQNKMARNLALFGGWCWGQYKLGRAGPEDWGCHRGPDLQGL
jgi:hypothetical protein